MTTFNSIDNIYRIDFGNTIMLIEMAKESLYYLSDEQVQQILTHVKVDITKFFTKKLEPMR